MRLSNLLTLLYLGAIWILCLIPKLVFIPPPLLSGDWGFIKLIILYPFNEYFCWHDWEEFYSIDYLELGNKTPDHWNIEDKDAVKLVVSKSGYIPSWGAIRHIRLHKSDRVCLKCGEKDLGAKKYFLELYRRAQSKLEAEKIKQDRQEAARYIVENT